MKYVRVLSVVLFALVIFQLFGCGSSESGLIDGDYDSEGMDTETSEEGITDGDEDSPEQELEADSEEELEIEGEGEGETDLDDVEPLFITGCPEEGLSSAFKITDENQKMYGPDAIGGLNDYLLMNNNAAFVIQGIENLNAYYIYSGIPIDAVALDGCKQASPVRFEEAGFLFGKLNVANFGDSVLRAFRGESVEIINDGTDGEAAVVRVHGIDDYFWLVEYTLITQAYEDGKPRGLSDPLGFEVFIDYILEPDSNVLKIELNFENTTDETVSFLMGAEVMFGDTTNMRYYSDGKIDIAGFELDQGIPWVVASGGDGAWAFGMKDSNLTTIEISGVNAMVDFNQVLTSPLTIKPQGEEGDSTQFTCYLSVGGTDPNSAVKHLHSVNPKPLSKFDYDLTKVSGVVEEEDETPIVGARVDLEMKNSQGQWLILDSFYSYDNGEFEGMIPKFKSLDEEYRLVAHLDGRPDSDPVEFEAGNSDSLVVTLTAAGVLDYNVTNQDDENIPAKILLWQDNKVSRYIFSTTGYDAIDVVPGEYGVSVTRGFEYSTYYGDITINAGQTATLDVTLTKTLDTSGYLSMDGHVHAGPSPDNWISIPERIASVASEGLEVVVSTDHECISDWSPGVDETGLGDWVVTVIGQEVTATIPEHTNMYPVVPDYSINARGGYIPWYQMDYEELFAAIREFGAGVIGVNHPTGYLRNVQFDVLSATPLMDDPTLLGLSDDSVLWDWDFDTFELMNGNKQIFASGQSGLFDYWMSFLNHGYKKTVVGVSDAHNYTAPGYPRTYFLSTSDEVTGFDEAELITAMTEGRALISTGAFARVKVNNSANMGDTITDTDGEIDLSLHIEAIEEIDVAYLKIYVNCDQVSTIATTSPDGVVKFNDTVKVNITKDSHIVVLGFGENSMPPGFKGVKEPSLTPRFVTNAIYIDYDGNGEFDAPGDKTCNYDTDGPVIE